LGFRPESCCAIGATVTLLVLYSTALVPPSFIVLPTGRKCSPKRPPSPDHGLTNYGPTYLGTLGMSESGRTIVEISRPGFKAHGIFKPGRQELPNLKPLVVLIHGGGCNASYFENDFHSVPNAFNATGFDVLSVNRAGYGGNPIPETTRPLLDAIPLYSALIKKTYEEHSSGKNGIVLVGHSLGAAISLSIAALEGEMLPLLGVSALGVIPTKEPPPILVNMLKADSENPRFVVEPSPEAVETFMGPPSVVDESILAHPSMPKIFEPGLKTELFEWWDVAWYDRFVNEVAPGVRVPLQFLAAEYELGWRGINEGQPIFDHAAGMFTNAPKLDARILPGGGHNFEFSKNASLLQKAREDFIDGLVR